jgi:GNAT superfamily N-acetyltransferase
MLPTDLSRLLYRRARPDDALCLGVLAIQVFMDTYATGGVRPGVAREVLGAFSTEACAAWLERSDCIVEVAELDGHLVAFSQTTLGAEHALAPAGAQAELFRLYVQEPFTAKGIGSALLRSAERCAAAAGAGVFWLTPWVHNRRALAFYAHHGYADHGQTWFEFEGERHENRLLARTLDAPR